MPRIVVIERVETVTMRVVEAVDVQDACHVVNIAQGRYMIGGDSQERARAAIVYEHTETRRRLDPYPLPADTPAHGAGEEDR